MNNEIKTERKFDLEERLIDFAIRISEVAESLQKTSLFNIPPKQVRGRLCSVFIISSLWIYH